MIPITASHAGPDTRPDAQEDPTSADRWTWLVRNRRPSAVASVAVSALCLVVLAAGGARTAGAPGPATGPASAVQPVAPANAIRPFRVNVPQAELDDLRRRIAATRWPDRETVDDRSQGVQLAKLQEIVRYWGTDYDWRKCEAKLNALPQFITNIDGLDIHFIHVRS
ncbi:MAG TPA: epoxide hydrolase N-terminal domain-containing protein, partial [Armatimonadota bacterium]|nr:epoxide hydrolase N-terminal domain-containing protein [Armatimonadota bacterium]